MTRANFKNSFLTVGFLAISSFYYWLNWSSEVPILGGDHAAYLLMADYLSPFGGRSHELAHAAMAYIYFPPLYPLTLGMVGATSAHIEIAHAVTVTFLIMALVWYFAWVHHETQSSYEAFLLTVIFAFLPTTFFQSFGILSENLYLLLSLVAIWFLARPDIPLARLYLVSIVIGLAAITRTIGIALVIAFAIYLFIHKRDQWIRLTLISLVPMFSWNVVKWLLGYQGGYLWIVNSAVGSKPLIHLLLDQLALGSHALWAGWIVSLDHIPSIMTLIAGSAIGIICLAGTMYRVYRGRFDGIYLVFCFGVLLLWPFSQPADTRRLLFIVMPVLLLHGLTFTCDFMRRFSSSRTPIFGYAYLLMIALVASPATGLIVQRFVMAAEEENRKYANSLYWYSGHNLKHDLYRTRMKIEAYNKFVLSWRRISEIVPEDECVYNVDPTWLMLYADRPSYSPPQASTKDQFFERARSCRYAYVASYSRPPYPLFYPRDYLGEGKIVFTDRLEQVQGEPILGMLIEMPRKDGPSMESGN